MISFECQVDSVYFDRNNAFEHVWHDILLHKSCVHGLSDGFVNLFRSYLTNWLLSVLVCLLFTHLFITFLSSFGNRTRISDRSFAA